MATKKKEKTVQELLREKQLEQIENFSIDDGEEEHSLDQILEAASQQGLLELYNPFEERAKKIAEEEAQAPKRPSEAQTARQTFDQLGNLGNMVKKTETETLPKITNEAVKNYNLSKVGRDYLSKYDDSTSYADVQKDIEELKYRKGGAERRDNDTGVYDRAIAMLEQYANNNYSLNDNKTSYADKEAIYEDNKQIEEGLGEKSNSATDPMYRDYALMTWLGSYDHKGIKDSATNQAAIKSFNEATGGKGYDLSNELGELKDNEIASKADELRTYFQDKYGYKYNTDYLNAAQNFYSDLQNRYNKAKTDNKTYERTGEAAAYTADIVKKDDYADKSAVGDYGTPTTKEDINEYLKNNQAVDYNNIQGFDSKNVDSLPDKLGSFLSAEDIKDQNTSSEFSPERKIAINLQKTDNAWTHPFDTLKSGYDDLMTEGYNNGWDVINDEEKGAYYYIYNTEGKEAAYEYLNSLKNTLQKRKNYDNVKEATQNSADSGTVDNLDFILRSAASVPDNAFGGASGTLDNVAHYISGEDIEPYSPAHAAALSAAATREATGEALDEQFWHTDSPWGVNPSDIYGGVMSSADMLTSYFTGEAPYGALMGLSAAESTARDLYEQGEDNATIAKVSTASGIAEALFEKLSIEQIWNIANLDGAKTAKEIVKKYAYNMARAAGVEASEEVATEAANMVVDNIVRGSRSDTADASIEDIGSRLYKAGVGGAIGGLLGGGGATTLSAVAKSAEITQDKIERNKYIASVGADVTNAGNTQALLDTADQMKDNAEVQAQAQKVRQAQTNNAEKGTESSAKTLSRETGKLYAAIQDSNAQGIQNAEADEIKAAIKQAYSAETGEDVKSDTVTQAAEAIYKSEYTGEKLTRAERNLASTSQAQSAVESVRNNPDLIEQGTQKAQERAFNKYISTAQLTQKQETKADEDVDIAEFNVHKDDGKVYTADGRKQVDIASVASIGKNDITFALKDGQAESAKALDMPTKQAVIAQSVLDVQKSMGVDLTPEIANTLYKGYEQSDIKSVSAYMQDAQKVLFNGYTNNTKIDNTINLPQGLRNRLYSMGRQLAASHTQAQQQAVIGRVKGNKPRKGSVTFVDGIKRGQLDSRRRAGVDTVENLAKSLGFDVVFYRSTKNGKGRYSSEYVRKNKFTAEGQQAPSGFWRGGKMYLDINAGMNGEGLILFTASHELVHMIREGSPEAFQELADFLVKNYAEQGVNINDLVLKEMSKSTNLTRDEAFEEVIAESCETFLRDTHLNDKAQELYKQNPTLWSRIREALKRIINAIKEAYAVARPQSEEARITNRADIETLEKAYDLWTKGIIKSAENLRNMERAGNGKARYSFAGRNAETADIGTLSDAILAEEEGATSEEIRKQTGWFRGMDGKWRFEIDDSDMVINITDKNSYSLGNFLKHQQLFDAYPSLDDVIVEFDDMPNNERGFYDHQHNLIAINRNIKTEPEKVLNTLVHEIQHAVQRIEGFASGASVSYWQSELSSVEGDTRTLSEKKREKNLWEKYEEAKKASPEFVEQAQRLFWLTQEVFFEDKGGAKEIEEIDKLQKSLYEKYGFDKVSRFSGLLLDLKRLSGKKGYKSTPIDLYESTAGEIEARDISNRRTLTAEQRKNTRPDIDREDVVFAKYQSRVDSNYLSAVERGDMETAQRMVDEAAKAAGYTIKAYHGTNAIGIKTFDKNKIGESTGVSFYGRGFYFTSSERDAVNYGKNVLPVYLKMENTLDIDNDEWIYKLGLKDYKDIQKVTRTSIENLGNGFYNIAYQTDKDGDKWHYINRATVYQVGDDKGKGFVERRINDNTILPRDIKGLSELAEKHGYDSIKGVGTNIGDVGTEYVVFNSNQVKSADPVTYDDDGNVIPLSERFNESNKDIRYQSRSSTDNITYKYAVKNNDTETAQKDDYSFDVIRQKQEELNSLRHQKKAIIESAEYKDLIDKVVNGDDISKLAEFEKTSGLKDVVRRVEQLQKEISEYNKAFQKQQEQKEIAEDEANREKSGLSEADYRRKLAVKQFGTTPYFYDAGYILPNGKMLNLSGTKNHHNGARGDDHRIVGAVYPSNYSGWEAVTKFMSDGNIRIMPESPGLDITSTVKPTKQQLNIIKRFIEETKGKGYFAVDFTDESGKHIGNLEYKGKFTADGIISDIERYYSDGELTKPSRLNEFRYQSRDDDLFSIDLSEDDTISDVAAREFVTHHEDMGEVLKNISDIDIEPKRVDSIINRVSREYLGSLDAEAKHTLSIEIQLALERVNNTDAQTVSDTIIDAVRRAIEKGTVSDERAEANYKDLLDAFKGKKFYLTDEQINQLKEHDMTLDSFRKAMFGKMTIVKRENAKRSINGGYADAQQLSLEGLHDVLADADAVLGLRSWQWDQENYDAPYIIKKAFDDLNKLRNQSVSQIYSDQDIDDMAVAMSAKITGGIVEEKYKSKYKGKDSQQIRKALAAEQKQTDDYIANLVDKLMEKHEAELAEQKKQSKQKLSELKQKERERAEKRETELKKKYQEQRDKSREGRKRTELRHKIRNLTDSLQKRLTKPKGSQYVPRQLIAQTVDILNAVNLDTGRSVRLSEKLALLRNEYDKLKDREESYAMYDGVISNMLLGLNDTVGNTSIMDMTLSQLKQVYDTIRSMDHVIRESVKMTDTNFKHDAHQVGRDWIAEIRAVPKSHVGALSGYVQTMLSAERFFNRIAGFKKNSTSLKLFDMLNKGQLATTQYEMEFTQIFADLIQDDKIKSLYDTKKMVDIGLVDDDGNKVPITRGMMLSLYMHLQNEDNIRHVMGGGLTVPDMKDYYKGDVKKAFGKGMKSVRVGQLDYSRYAEGIKSVIEKQLTEYERGWIEAAHEFFDEASRKALNETTMKLYGFRRANVDNYFPIHTDSNYRAASFENIVRDMSLENSGFMKERVKASNPILLEDIVDVVNDQISKTAKYCGMTLPIKNFEKVYGTTTVGFDTSVQKELNKKFSASSSNTGATKYIDNLLTDLTSGRSSDDGPFAKRLGRARGFLAQSTLTLNPRVAIAQTASVVTAAPVVGYKNITKALTSQYFKVSDEEIAEITPLFWLRRQGYATIEIGDIATLRKQKHKIQSKAAKALNWINAMDSWAVRRLFVASKYYMQENYSNLDPQSDEYKQKLSEVYNKVIEKTQPNYTVLQRPDILRNPNALLKSLTMFMTQRLQNFNIIYDSVGTFNKYNADYKAGINNVTADDVKEARSTLIRSITSQVASAATIVGMKLFADFLLHSMNGYRDDDDEITAESLSLTLLDNFADTVFGNILFASELYSAVKSLVFKKRYYGISLSGISSIVDAITDIINLNNGVTVESVNKVAMSVCQVLGIPLRNAEKIGKAIYYWISDISSGEFMESGIERNTKQNIHRYETKLLSGDNDGAKKIVDEMLEKKKAKGKNDKDAKSDVRSNFTTEYKKRYLEALKNNNAEEIKNIRQTLYSSGLYGTLSDLDKVMQKWVAADKKEQSK